MMSCPSDALLLSYIFGELDEEEILELCAHFTKCYSCQARRERFELVEACTKRILQTATEEDVEYSPIFRDLPRERKEFYKKIVRKHPDFHAHEFQRGCSYPEPAVRSPDEIEVSDRRWGFDE